MSQLAAFGATLAAELPWYVAGLVTLRLARWWVALLAGVGVNLLTHPVLWWALAPSPTLPRLAAAELGVWVAETALLFAVVRRQPALLAVLCAGANATSVVIGLLA